MFLLYVESYLPDNNDGDKGTSCLCVTLRPSRGHSRVLSGESSLWIVNTSSFILLVSSSSICRCLLPLCWPASPSGPSWRPSPHWGPPSGAWTGPWARSSPSSSSISSSPRPRSSASSSPGEMCEASRWPGSITSFKLLQMGYTRCHPGPDGQGLC